MAQLRPAPLAGEDQAPLTIHITQADGQAIVTVAGELDLSTANRLAQKLDVYLAGVEDLVLDLHGVSFIDAAGLRVLIAARDCRHGRRHFKIVPGESVTRMLWLCHLDGSFETGGRPHLRLLRSSAGPRQLAV